MSNDLEINAARCAAAIGKAIAENFAGYTLAPEAVSTVVEKFGREQVAFVLASTVVQRSWDGRFQAENRTWAASQAISLDPYLTVNAHPGLVDVYLSIFRREVENG